MFHDHIYMGKICTAKMNVRNKSNFQFLNQKKRLGHLTEKSKLAASCHRITSERAVNRQPGYRPGASLSRRVFFFLQFKF